MGERLEPRRGTDRGHAAPAEKGNIGIAGHRDGFFRELKEISRGDVIEIETTSAQRFILSIAFWLQPRMMSACCNRATHSRWDARHLWCYGMITAAPAIESFFTAARASFARSSGNTVVLGRRLISLAI
jgi:hypothetical protein